MVVFFCFKNTDGCNGVSPLSSSDTSPVHYPSSDTSPVHYPNGVANVDGSPGLSLADSGHRVQLQDLDFLLTKDDNNMPTKDGSNLPATDGSNLPATDGSILPATDGSNLSATDGSILPARDGSNLPATDGSNLLSLDDILPSKDRDCSNLPVEADSTVVCIRVCCGT